MKTKINTWEIAIIRATIKMRSLSIIALAILMASCSKSVETPQTNGSPVSQIAQAAAATPDKPAVSAISFTTMCAWVGKSPVDSTQAGLVALNVSVSDSTGTIVSGHWSSMVLGKYEIFNGSNKPVVAYVTLGTLAGTKYTFTAVDSNGFSDSVSVVVPLENVIF